MRTNTKSFFKEFYKFESDLEKYPNRYSDLVKQFYKLLKQYLESKKWVNREIEWQIFEGYSKYSDKEQAEMLGLTISNYRVILNRLTLRLNSQLFYGDTISTIVSDEDIVPDAIDNLKQLLLQVDLDREFPKEFVENNKTKSTDKELKDKAKTLALVNLVLHSSTMQTVLDSYFDKDAIPYLLENINDEDYLMEYRKIKRKLRHSETITDLANNLIDVIENNNY